MPRGGSWVYRVRLLSRPKLLKLATALRAPRMAELVGPWHNHRRLVQDDRTSLLVRSAVHSLVAGSTPTTRGKTLSPRQHQQGTRLLPTSERQRLRREDSSLRPVNILVALESCLGLGRHRANIDRYFDDAPQANTHTDHICRTALVQPTQGDASLSRVPRLVAHRTRRRSETTEQHAHMRKRKRDACEEMHISKHMA